MPVETSQTLDRGLRLLTLLAETGSALTVSEIAQRLDLNRTIVYRLVATLEMHRLVRRTGDGQVQIGTGALQLARGVRPVIRDAARPILRGLAEAVGATAHLTVVDGGEALAVAVVEPSWTDLHVSYRVGSRHPLERGAAGKAILAARDEPVREYVVTQGELQTGAHGLAAPLRDVYGIEGSVGVVSLGAFDVTQVAPKVITAATAVADSLRG